MQTFRIRKIATHGSYKLQYISKDSETNMIFKRILEAFVPDELTGLPCGDAIRMESESISIPAMKSALRAFISEPIDWHVVDRSLISDHLDQLQVGMCAEHPRMKITIKVTSEHDQEF